MPRKGRKIIHGQISFGGKVHNPVLRVGKPTNRRVVTVEDIRNPKSEYVTYVIRRRRRKVVLGERTGWIQPGLRRKAHGIAISTARKLIKGK